MLLTILDKNSTHLCAITKNSTQMCAISTSPFTTHVSYAILVFYYFLFLFSSGLSVVAYRSRRSRYLKERSPKSSVLKNANLMKISKISKIYSSIFKVLYQQSAGISLAYSQPNLSLLSC